MRIAAAKQLLIHPRSRLLFEVAAAAFLTLCAVILAGKSMKAAPAPAKIALQAPIPAAASPAQGDGVVDFMEKFALSRVSPRLPETAGVPPPTEPAAIAARPAKLRVTVVKNPPPVINLPAVPVSRVIERQPTQVVALEPEHIAPVKPARRIPILTDVAEKIPSPHEITSAISGAFSNVGRKVGSIFGRS